MSRKPDPLGPRRIPTQDRAKERVQRILVATSELLCESGVSAVTTARVAERAGVPVGSVYQYFPNKKAIFVALFDEYLQGVRDALEAMERDGPYEEGWRAFTVYALAGVKKAESPDVVEVALRVACRAFPDLSTYEDEHVALVVESMVRIFKRLGSRWPRPKLRRLMHYAYLMNEASLRYRFEHKPPVRENLEWDQKTALAIYGLCMEE